jgi:alpha-L-fucosidase
MQDRTAWLAERGWGVLCHYLGAPPSSDGGKELSAEAWNAQVDAFDVPGLARQLVSVGARYFFITIGQNSGHFLAPNATYDRLTGMTPSKCSRRDLVSELYEALAPHDIALLVYLPSGAPAAEPAAVSALEWDWGYEGGWPKYSQRTGKRLASFQQKWEAVIRDWSLRWGDKVRGWWIDGCYFADEMYRHPDEPNFASLAAALRAGNPASLVCFNPGVLPRVICHTEVEDFTAGEIADALPECKGPWVMRQGHRARLHILSYLGQTWCGGAPRFPDELVVGYTKHVLSHGGAMTWDVPISKHGLLPEPFVRQLAALKQGLA